MYLSVGTSVGDSDVADVSLFLSEIYATGNSGGSGAYFLCV
jgi:hypothetical protein